MINLGLTTAGNQGNLLTGQAAALAAGDIGAANARSAGAGNILNLGAQIGGAAFGAFGGAPGASATTPFGSAANSRLDALSGQIGGFSLPAFSAADTSLGSFGV